MGVGEGWRERRGEREEREGGRDRERGGRRIVSGSRVAMKPFSNYQTSLPLSVIMRPRSLHLCTECYKKC